jgi:hypothetical protein
MASRKNRSRKSNRRSPNAVLAWVERHRRALVIGAFVFLFVDAVVGGYWVAQRFEPSKAAKVTYARIEDIPGLPRYVETEPDQKLGTFEDKPKPQSQPQPQPAPQVAAAASTQQPQQQQTWQRNAVPFRDLRGKPLIAIVIDDVGIDRLHSKRAWELPGPLTMSFLPYSRDLHEQAKAARAHGQELMLHLPMEPMGHADPGPNALKVALTDSELKQRVTTALDSFDGYVGVNNHMGSRFTAYRPGMEIVLKQFRARGLLFLDSRTTRSSVGDQVAQELGVPSVTRNVFLDDDESPDAVRRELAETEAVARRQGFAVAIGHPHETTLQALAEWLPTVAGKGFVLAPLSAVLRKRNGWD